MKSFFLIMASTAIFTVACYGQDVYKSTKTSVKFFSHSILEDIEATTSKSGSAFNMATREVGVLIPITTFVFHRSLMQEHFNENYLESDKYPEASFAGKLDEKYTIKPGEEFHTMAKGILTIHGVSQSREIPLTLKMNDDGVITSRGMFNIKLADHNIKIPTLVFQNIAEVVEVTFDFTLMQVRQRGQ
jgi:hypothetical protein